MSMTSMIHGGLHKLFFPGLKVAPKSDWKSALAVHGAIEEVKITRQGSKKIAAIIVTPTTTLSNVTQDNPKRIAAVSARGTVVFAHPLSRKAKYFFSDGLRIKNYLDAGYRVVIFDFNGFGESDKTDLYFWKDAAAVIEYVKQRFSQEPVVFHGISFGSFHGIRALAALPENGRVVLENTPRSLYDYWKYWWHTRLAVWLLDNKLYSPRFVKDMNVIDALQQLNRPDIHFLFITCANDKITPTAEVKDLASHVRSEKYFLHVENAKHLEAPVVAAQQYNAAILSMLTK